MSSMKSTITDITADAGKMMFENGTGELKATDFGALASKYDETVWSMVQIVEEWYDMVEAECGYLILKD